MPPPEASQHPDLSPKIIQNYWNRYAERWVQIKYFLVERKLERGLQAFHYAGSGSSVTMAAKDEEKYWSDPWLPDWLIYAFQRLFADASRVFDELFYKSTEKPEKRTRKDMVYGKPKSATLSRHNFLHYNYVFQQLHLIVGFYMNPIQPFAYYDLYKAGEYFPLHHSIEGLNERWKEICTRLNWPFFHFIKSS
jgi:hypothetical protein